MGKLETRTLKGASPRRRRKGYYAWKRNNPAPTCYMVTAIRNGKIVEWRFGNPYEALELLGEIKTMPQYGNVVYHLSRANLEFDRWANSRKY